MIILLTNIESRIKFQVLRIVGFWSPLDIDQGISHKANHLNLTFFIAHIDNHDGVRSGIGRVLANSLVRTQNKDINPILGILTIKGLNYSRLIGFTIITCSRKVCSLVKLIGHGYH